MSRNSVGRIYNVASSSSMHDMGSVGPKTLGKQPTLWTLMRKNKARLARAFFFGATFLGTFRLSFNSNRY